MWLYLNSQIVLGGQLLLYCNLDLRDVYVWLQGKVKETYALAGHTGGQKAGCIPFQ